MQEDTIPMPKYLQARLAGIIHQNSALADIEFERAEFGFSETIHPKLVLQGVKLSGPTTTANLNLNNLEVIADVWGLLGQKLKPRRVLLTGAVIDMSRNAEGGFDFGIGASSQTTSIASVDETINQLEEYAKHPMLASLSQVRLDDLTVNYLDRRSGKAWTFDGGRLIADKTARSLNLRADLALLAGGEDLATLALSYDRRGKNPGRLRAEFQNIHTQDLAVQSPALAWLQLVDAKIQGSLQTQSNPDGLGVMNAHLDFGAGEITPGPGAEPFAVQSAKAYFSYEPESARLDVDVLSISSQKGQGIGQGYALVKTDDATGSPTGIVFHVQGAAQGVRPSQDLNRPLDVTNLSAVAKLQFDPFVLTVGDARFGIEDTAVTATGTARLEDEHWVSSLRLDADHVDPRKLLTYWPETVLTKSRAWLEQNVTRGALSDISIGFDREKSSKVNILSSFAFTDANVRFMKRMPLIMSANGVGLFDNGRLDVTLFQGYVPAPEGGKMQIAGSSMHVPDMRAKPAQARFDLVGQSTITAALSLLDQPPMEVMQKAGRPVTLADGRVNLSATIDVPLQRGNRPEDVNYRVAGTIRNLRSQSIVPDRLLTANALNLLATPEGVEISGKTRLGQVGADMTWTQPLGQKGQPGRVVADVEISPQFLDEFNIALPPGTLRGQGKGRLNLTLQRDHPVKFELTSRMAGLGISIPAVGYQLPRNQQGNFSIAGELGKPTKIDGFSIDAPGLRTAGTLQLTNAGAFDRAVLNDLRLGNWLRSDVTVIGQGRERPVSLVLRGGELDLRISPFGRSAQSGGGTGNIVAALDRLILTNTLSITDLQAEFLAGSGLNGQFAGRVNGGTVVSGFTKRETGGLRIDIKSNNAGGALRDAGLLKQADSGLLDLTLQSQDGGWLGSLKVKDARVKDAPAVAALLSAVSVIGILEQLDGKGLLFSDIRAEFMLKNNQFTLFSSSAVGPSLGLSLDGFINTQTNQLDLQGVLSPFYLLNGLGAIFTRRGEGLIGFNFNLRGPTAKPAVAVNPLSALTPGMFREIFRRPPPKQE